MAAFTQMKDSLSLSSFGKHIELYQGPMHPPTCWWNTSILLSRAILFPSFSVSSSIPCLWSAIHVFCSSIHRQMIFWPRSKQWLSNDCFKIKKLQVWHLPGVGLFSLSTFPVILCLAWDSSYGNIKSIDICHGLSAHKCINPLFVITPPC